MGYEFLKLAHVIGASVLFGTGLGIAFFLFWAVRSRDVQLIAGVTGIVVVADYLFTLTAAILQPITGILLVKLVGYSFSDCWVGLSLIFYLLIGICWVPVVFMQKEMRDLAVEASAKGDVLGARFFVLYKRWFLFGWPAFLLMIGIFALMIVKPSYSYCS